MRAYARKFRGISADCCAQLYEEVRLPAHIRAHCRAVGDLAARMAESLISRGACLDVNCAAAEVICMICAACSRIMTGRGIIPGRKGVWGSGGDSRRARRI